MLAKFLRKLPVTQLLAVPSDSVFTHPDASAEKARSVLAAETAPGGLVGEGAAGQPGPVPPSSINFSLRQWGTELR